jgi:YtxH-like protein
METKKILMSLGAALAASKLAKTISNVELDDVLGTIGLARRRHGYLEGFALLAAGAVIGAGSALLLAPASGAETRRRLGSQATKLHDAALDAVRQQKDEAMRTLSEVANGAVSAQRT